MTIITRRRRDNCIVVPIDDRLSFEAHCVLAYVLANRRQERARHDVNAAWNTEWMDLEEAFA